MKKKFNFGGITVKTQWNEAQADGPVEVMIYDTIGADPWSGGGIKASDFRSTLNQIPKDRSLNIRVNSKGGDVHEGIAMRNALMEWPKPVNTTLDGIAASTSSWAFAPGRDGDTVRAYRNSQMFLHDAIAFGLGNAEDLRRTADDLDKTSDTIAQMYADKTGKGKRTMRQVMKEETLLTGEEAEEMGLVDELIDGKAVQNFKPADLTQMQNALRAFYNSVAKDGENQTKPDTMKRKIIALLNKHGVTQLNGAPITAEMTDDQMKAVNEEQLEAELNKILNAKQPASAPAPANDDIATLRREIAGLTEANNSAKRLRVTGAVELLIANDQLPAALKDKSIERAMKDDTYLDELRALPAKPPGSAPLSASIELVSEAIGDVQNHVLNNTSRLTGKFIGPNTGRMTMDDRVLLEITNGAFAAASAIRTHKSKIVEAWNSNAIDAALQRQVILQDMLEAYAIPLLNLNIFSVVYQNVPLEGTDKVEVPYFPLQTNAASSFVKGTGYTTFQDWTQNSREVLVGGDGDSGTTGASAAANTAKDRKFIGINFTSYDLARQPYLNITKLFQQAANKLGVDIFTDIVSRVITKASFGNGTIAAAAAAFNADNVAKLRELATGAYWPNMGRSLVLDHTYYTPLLQDPSFKQYLAYGSSDPIQKGRIENAYGFENIVELANLTTYGPTGEHLVGWMNHKSAVLVATANIMPTPAVRVVLEQFDIVADGKMGISFAHRKFADPVKDQTNDIVECSYGANKGVAAALQRQVSTGT